MTRGQFLSSEERGWTRGELAETDRGRSCRVTDRRALKFCAMGALIRAALTFNDHDLLKARCDAEAIAFALLRGAVLLTSINDFQGQKAVLKVFDKALAA